MEEQQIRLPLELALKSTTDKEQPDPQLQPPLKKQRVVGRRRGGVDTNQAKSHKSPQADQQL